MRCASPPESVIAPRESVRYSRPTSRRNPRRARTSFSTSSAITARAPSRRSDAKCAAASATVIAKTSTIDLPSTKTARDSGFKRRPSHALHFVSRRNVAIFSRTASLVVSFQWRSSFGTTPSHFMSHEPSLDLPCHETRTRRSAMPKRITSRCFCESLFQGFSRSIFMSRARAPTTRARQPVSPSATVRHGSTAPSEIESAGFGTTRSRSTSMRVPSPLHSGHMPSGELYESICGVSSGKLTPHAGHERASEYARGSASPSTSTRSCPSPARSAVSTLSVRRERDAGSSARRSTTSSMVCFVFLSRPVTSSRLTTLPSTRTRE